MNSATRARLPLQLHVGDGPPALYGEWSTGAAERGEELDDVARRFHGRSWHGRSPLTLASFPWARLGVEPRFVGEETTGCVAALQPSIFHSRGADEFDRFRAAAAQRGEPAQIVSLIGDDSPEPTPGSVLSR